MVIIAIWHNRKGKKYRMKNIQTYLKTVNRRAFTNNTQRALFKLLSANGAWVSRGELNRSVRSASSRVRDLRKAQFGRFTVQCESATTLKRGGDISTFYYRINPRTVNRKQLDAVFGV